MSAGENSGRFAATPDELRRYGEDGFFVRSAVFAPAELEVLRQAVEKVVAEAGEHGGKTYEIDGNRYRDTEAATLQYEHHASAETIRVIEPFHHLHPDLDRLVDDPRMTEAICGILVSGGGAVDREDQLQAALRGLGFSLAPGLALLEPRL